MCTNNIIFQFDLDQLSSVLFHSIEFKKMQWHLTNYVFSTIGDTLQLRLNSQGKLVH